MPFVRPELGVLSILLPVLKGVPLLRAGRRRQLGVLALLVSAGAAPSALWSLIATGALMP